MLVSSFNVIFYVAIYRMRTKSRANPPRECVFLSGASSMHQVATVLCVRALLAATELVDQIFFDFSSYLFFFFSNFSLILSRSQGFLSLVKKKEIV